MRSSPPPVLFRPSVTGSSLRRRRRVRARLLVGSLASVVVLAAWSASTTRSQGADASDLASGVATGEVVPGDAAANASPGGRAAGATAADGDGQGAQQVTGPAAAGEPEATTPPLARLGRLQLHLPAAVPLVVGYHEASHVSAADLVPVGRLLDDRNTTRTDLPRDQEVGDEYLVLSSRGRAAGPTSAVDIVLPTGTEVLAPVTGTVLDVRDYELYGAHEDLRIEIVPDARPDLRVVLIHLDGGRVRVGDRVQAGVTPIAATARRFPFSSHIDRETEPERFPHVHIEVQPIDAPRPGDEDEEDDEEDDEGEGEQADEAGTGAATAASG